MFPGNPNVLLSCSATPAGLLRLAFTALRVLSPPLKQRGLQRCVSFEALSPDFGTGCLRFVPPLLRGYARLASGGGQPFRVGL
jgi:hypothetical protein